MKKFLLLFFVFMEFGITGSINSRLLFAKSLVWEELEPQKQNQRVKISIKGNKTDYYSVAKEEPMEIEIEGPRKLLVRVRNCFLVNEADQKEYRINVLLDDRNFDEYVFHAKQTRLASLMDNAENIGLGSEKKFVIEVPEGKHLFKFFPADSNEKEKFYLRFYVTEPTAAKEKRLAMSPDKYQEVVDLIYKERDFTYYRMSPGKPVELMVVGPTELKIITRLEFNRRTKGKSSYQIQIFEDNQLIQTRQYRTYKSDVASYKKVTNITPGRSRAFLIPVSKGKHIYRLIPVTMQKQTVLVKVLIPEKDIAIIKE